MCEAMQRCSWSLRPHLASNEAIDIGTEKDKRDEDEAGVLEGFRRRVLRNGAGEAVTFITIDCLLCKATLRTKKGLIVQHFGSSTLASCWTWKCCVSTAFTLSLWAMLFCGALWLRGQPVCRSSEWPRCFCSAGRLSLSRARIGTCCGPQSLLICNEGRSGCRMSRTNIGLQWFTWDLRGPKYM